ncbi:MAG TPA: prephenate dehydrogenase/arogenate dehydrogenase family protein [Gemmatimonadales bacterium]|nr:prephenate dehydrogenase/arogenate dehydrogenase family protein [Gemmatimonadales bacterium]
MQPRILGVIGLGAIGGSLARQAKEAGVSRVIGWSPDPSERAAALRAGALDDASGSAATVAALAELLVLAAPPAANLSLLDTLHAVVPPQAFITDVGSVKRAIVARAETLGFERFAGSHPLAGTHARGFGASRADLFRGAVVYVTPTAQGATAAKFVTQFWEQVCGARTVTVSAAAHDAEIALTSHLPQVVASLLGGYLAAHTTSRTPLGPGARDTTRLAASEPALWTEILLMNRDEVVPLLRALEEPLADLARALEQGDAARVLEWFRTAAEWRRGLEQ